MEYRARSMMVTMYLCTSHTRVSASHKDSSQAPHVPVDGVDGGHFQAQNLLAEFFVVLRLEVQDDLGDVRGDAALLRRQARLQTELRRHVVGDVGVEQIVEYLSLQNGRDAVNEEGNTSGQHRRPMEQ